MDQIKIGKFIAQLRRDNNLTQEEFANVLNVTNRTVSRWENGNYMPDISIMKEISEYFNISLMELLNGEKEENLELNDYEKVLEEAIDDSIKVKRSRSIFIGIVFLIIAIILFFNAIEYWTAFTYYFFGFIALTISALCLGRKKQKLITLVLSLVIAFVSIYIKEQIWASQEWGAPYLFSSTHPVNETDVYETKRYNYYIINKNTPSEYHVYDPAKRFDEYTLPLSPYNNGKITYGTYTKYRVVDPSDQLQHQIKTINHLPLFEHMIENNQEFIDYSVNKDAHLNIVYDVSDTIYKESLFVEKTIIFNSMVLFSFSYNLESIDYTFSNATYSVSRDRFFEQFKAYDVYGSWQDSESKIELVLEEVFFKDEIVKNIFFNSVESK